MFDKKEGGQLKRGDEDEFVVMRARRLSKRRRALQKAAAAAAVERARRARETLGAPAKGGGGKGKGADEREEECSICQSEFTVWVMEVLLFVALHRTICAMSVQVFL